MTALEPLTPPAKRLRSIEPAADFLGICVSETLTGLFGEAAAKILYSRYYASECVNEPEKFINAIRGVVGDCGAEIISKLISRCCSERLSLKQPSKTAPALSRWRDLAK